MRSEKNRFGIKKIGLFDSVVRNDANQTSDLDILIEFDPATVPYRKYLDLKKFHQSVFPRPIEILTRYISEVIQV